MKSLYALLLSCAVAGAATITGNLEDITGTAYSPTPVFSPLSTPLADGNKTVLDVPRPATVNAGAFSVTLKGGNYSVDFGKPNKAIKITVPNDNGTYTLNQAAALYGNSLPAFSFPGAAPHAVWAGPSSGTASGGATFRALTSADLPPASPPDYSTLSPVQSIFGDGVDNLTITPGTGNTDPYTWPLGNGGSLVLKGGPSQAGQPGDVLVGDGLGRVLINPGPAPSGLYFGDSFSDYAISIHHNSGSGYTLTLPNGAAAGAVLTSDANGNANWAAIPSYTPPDLIHLTGVQSFQFTPGAAAHSVLVSDGSGNASWASSLALDSATFASTIGGVSTLYTIDFTAGYLAGGWTAQGGLGIANGGLWVIGGISADTLTLSTAQAANSILAAPSTGAGSPTFRTLAAADIPSLDASKVASGTFATARIPNLDASAIASGTFAAGRIPSTLTSETLSSPTLSGTITLGSGGSSSSVLVSDSGSHASWSSTPTVSKLTLNGSGSTDSLLKLGASLEFQPYGLNNCWFGDNAYFDGTSFRYRSSGYAGLFYFQGQEGQFRFQTSGTAGSSYTPAVQLKINQSGTVAIGGNIATASGSYTGASMTVDANGVVTVGNTTPSLVLGSVKIFTGSTAPSGGTPSAPNGSLYLYSGGNGGLYVMVSGSWVAK